MSFVSHEVKFYPPFSREALELIGKERTARFGDPAHLILVLGFGECCPNQFFGDVLSDQPVEPSRVPVAAYIEHFENETTDSYLLRS
jgi:hypothetical protein